MPQDPIGAKEILPFSFSTQVMWYQLRADEHQFQNAPSIEDPSMGSHKGKNESLYVPSLEFKESFQTHTNSIWIWRRNYCNFPHSVLFLFAWTPLLKTSQVCFLFQCHSLTISSFEKTCNLYLPRTLHPLFRTIWSSRVRTLSFKYHLPTQWRLCCEVLNVLALAILNQSTE